jgi:hypothetical protein
MEPRPIVVPRVATRLLRRLVVIGAVSAALPGLAAPATAQTWFRNLENTAELEQRLRDDDFRIANWRGSRAQGDRTNRVALVFDDDSLIVAKWATAPTGGGTFNNEPRYELAAYELQKLFLDEQEYVVPPTVLRAVPLALVREHAPATPPTFGEAPGSVVVALQYWLLGVQPDDFWDPRRAASDSVYARYIGNFNIVTFVVRHGDDNKGNFLISANPDNPRVFSVDNGVSFGSQDSDRGHTWRSLRVRRLPRHTVERLRAITAEDLERALAVMAEFEIQSGVLVPVSPGENMNANRGVRRSRERIQFGLTAREIRGVESRIQQLLRQADGSRIELF